MGGDNAQAGWGRRRRRRWRHVAERKRFQGKTSENQGKARETCCREERQRTQGQGVGPQEVHGAEIKAQQRTSEKGKAPQKQEGQSMLDPYVLQTREVYGTPPLLVHQLPQRQTRRLAALRTPEAGRSVQVQAQASQVQDDRQQEQEGLQEIQEDSIQGKEEKVPQAH